MSDNTNTDDQAGKTGDATGEKGGGNDQPKMLTQAEVDDLIKTRLERAEIAWRKKAELASDSGKSEAEKLNARLQAAESRLRETEGRESVRVAARRAGAADADIVYRFIKSDIEFDSDGSPTNVDALIADAKQTAPQLFKAAPSRVDGGAGNGAKAGKFDMNARIRQAAGYGSS